MPLISATYGVGIAVWIRNTHAPEPGALCARSGQMVSEALPTPLKGWDGPSCRRQESWRGVVFVRVWRHRSGSWLRLSEL